MDSNRGKENPSNNLGPKVSIVVKYAEISVKLIKAKLFAIRNKLYFEI
jgi:hypothetical protein